MKQALIKVVFLFTILSFTGVIVTAMNFSDKYASVLFYYSAELVICLFILYGLNGGNILNSFYDFLYPERPINIDLAIEEEEEFMRHQNNIINNKRKH